jgi:hypothetical protein
MEVAFQQMLLLALTVKPQFHQKYAQRHALLPPKT